MKTTSSSLVSHSNSFSGGLRLYWPLLTVVLSFSTLFVRLSAEELTSCYKLTPEFTFGFHTENKAGFSEFTHPNSPKVNVYKRQDWTFYYVFNHVFDGSVDCGGSHQRISWNEGANGWTYMYADGSSDGDQSGGLISSRYHSWITGDLCPPWDIDRELELGDIFTEFCEGFMHHPGAGYAIFHYPTNQIITTPEPTSWISTSTNFCTAYDIEEETWDFRHTKTLTVLYTTEELIAFTKSMLATNAQLPLGTLEGSDRRMMYTTNSPYEKNELYKLSLVPSNLEDDNHN